VALAAVSLACACGGVEAHPPNILLILVDTLRADHLGTYGYPLETSPEIDRFAAENRVFRYAVSPAPWTSPAVASIFTGLYPAAHGVLQHVSSTKMPNDAISPDLATLAELLRDAGYATAGVTANAWVSEPRGYAQGFDRFESMDHENASVVNETARALLDALRKRRQPFFLYVHYMDPHPPYEPPPDLVRRFRAAMQGRGWSPRPRLLNLIALYDAEIHLVDRGIGSFFSYLRKLGLYDEMVIAVTADHGEQFFERGALGHGEHLHNEETHVPLILKGPGLTGEVDTTVSTIDLAPTLLELAGVEAPNGIQGVSLLSQLSQRERRGVFSEGTVGRNHKAFVTGDARKIVLAFGGRSDQVVGRDDETGVVGIFDARGNYGEDDPVRDERAIDPMRERLFEVYDQSVAIGRTVEPATVELDEESVRRLEKLGYLEEREPTRGVLLPDADIVPTPSARSNPGPGVPR
jgi:arylsulfatase